MVVRGLIKLLGKSWRPMRRSSGFGSLAFSPLPGICRALSSFPAHKIIKGQCHEIFDFWFFSLISFPQKPLNIPISNWQSATGEGPGKWRHAFPAISGPRVSPRTRFRRRWRPQGLACEGEVALGLLCPLPDPRPSTKQYSIPVILSPCSQPYC